MNQNITIYCKNNGQSCEVPVGSTLDDAYRLLGLQMEQPPVIAHVNNKVEGLRYRLYKPKHVEFLDITSASGLRCYTRTLFFVLCKAAHELWPGCRVSIDIPVSNGYYVDLQFPADDAPDAPFQASRQARPVTLDD